jgi:lysophospholipase L1-like esterase
MDRSDMRFGRRRFLGLSALGVVTLVGNRRSLAQTAVEPRVDDSVAWYDVRDWGVEGRGWADTARYFDRLPARAEGVVRSAVWNLSRHSAGMSVRFETDASSIHVRYSLLSGNLAMPHMPATGVSGLDLYACDSEGRQRWLAVARPTAQQMQVTLAADIDPPAGGGRRSYTLYLPLYNGVESLEIGVATGANFLPVSPRSDKPLVFYGTSIMHGACASRPGMSITGILGRRLDRPVINLGFSGNGTMDAEVGGLLAELDPCAYVIDCLPNMQADAVAERTEPLVRQLRTARPETPILLVEDRTYTYAPFRKSARDRHATSRAALRHAYNSLISAGVGNLYYLEGQPLLGDDGEAATDGSHPSDLGMVRYADAYETILRKLVL